VIKGLVADMREFLDRQADKGWTSLEDFRGLRRDRVVPHSQIKRPDAKEYHGGHDEGYEGYAPQPADLAGRSDRAAS
jgi:dihydropyrimidine dehydrogenase (NAD+) subunit PreA